MTAGRRLRVVLVEDEPLFRGLLSAALSRDPALEVVGSYGDGADAVAAAAALRPDAALLDLELGPGLDGVRTGLLMRRSLPKIGLVLLSQHACPRLLTSLPPGEARGWSYLLKRSACDLASLQAALRLAARGAVTVDPALLARRRPHASGPLASLSPRQVDTVQLLALGWSNARIAAHLAVSPRTVDNQLSRIYAVLGLDAASDGVNPRVRAVLTYLSESYEVPEAGPEPAGWPEVRRPVAPGA